MKKRHTQAPHPAIGDLHSDMRHGTLSRRSFLRLATLLGASWATAGALAGCGRAGMGGEATVQPRRGGVLKVGTDVSFDVTHPARLSWVHQANQWRQVAEYLTLTDPHNITHPWLLDRWEPSEDVKTWTLYLRQGITFNNGDELTADDVIFTFEQWLDPEIGSSMLALLSYLRTSNIERVDDYTIRLHLDSPQIGIPEHLFHYPALILHRGFEGDFFARPVGTGPFELADYQPGEQTLFERRSDYWRMGADDQPLPYLDRLEYIDLEPDDRVAAMQAGLIDTIYRPRTPDWEALRNAPEVTVQSVRTAQTLVLRMRVDRPPWDDVRVRNALKACQDRQKILDVSFYGQGDLGHDAHVAPAHPAYCAKSPPPYDPALSRRLLREAGYEDGLSVRLITKNDQAEPDMARTLRDLAAEGGFTLDLDILEPSRYWEQWTEVDLGITTWEHRPLDTMVLALAYTTDERGEPVPWNETRWHDDEFAQLLTQAEGIRDDDERRAIMCPIEEIMQERGPVGISYWRNVWNITRSEFAGVQAHPSNYDLFTEVWKTTI